MRRSPEIFVGIDVSKQQLDVAVRPSGEQWSTPNAPPAFEAFINRVKAVEEVQIEGMFPDGTKLVTLHNPIR